MTGYCSDLGIMKNITSKDNPIYKKALRLTRKKYRDETGLYLLEGVKPLEDALGMGIRVSTVFLREGSEEKYEFPDSIAIRLERELFENLSETRNSQGVIAVAEKKLYSRSAFAEAVSDGNILIMDRLQDPGNIGTIIRTAEAAGYRGIMMSSGSGDVYAPKVVRAAAGSLFRMPVINVSGAAEAADIAEELGKRLVVTCLDAELSCFEADLTENIALVIGNEGSGVSEEFIKASHIKIKIPMEGSIESLNAAVAAGILMYQSQKIN